MRWAIVVGCLLWPSAIFAAPITIQNLTTVNPPARLHIATVDLSDPAVTVRVVAAGGATTKPVGWETTLALPSVVAEREHFALVINGDLFWTQKKLNLFGQQTPYFPGNAANVCGWSMTDGTVWSHAPGGAATLIVFTDGHVSIGRLDRIPDGVCQAVSGSDLIEVAGRNVAPSGGKANQHYPRTAVGTDRAGRMLLMVVVDGHREVSPGMTMRELADEMIKLGCVDAMALDGGGSSVMVRRNADGMAKVISWPSDGHDLPLSPSLQRPVASVVGICSTTQPAVTP